MKKTVQCFLESSLALAFAMFSMAAQGAELKEVEHVPLPQDGDGYALVLVVQTNGTPPPFLTVYRSEGDTLVASHQLKALNLDGLDAFAYGGALPAGDYDFVGPRMAQFMSEEFSHFTVKRGAVADLGRLVVSNNAGVPKSVLREPGLRLDGAIRSRFARDLPQAVAVLPAFPAWSVAPGAQESEEIAEQLRQRQNLVPAEASDGSWWFAGSHGMFLRRDPKGTWIEGRLPLREAVMELFALADGAVLAVTEYDGLYLLASDGSVRAIPDGGLTGQKIAALSCDAKNRCVAVTIAEGKVTAYRTAGLDQAWSSFDQFEVRDGLLARRFAAAAVPGRGRIVLVATPKGEGRETLRILDAAGGAPLIVRSKQGALKVMGDTVLLGNQRSDDNGQTWAKFDADEPGDSLLLQDWQTMYSLGYETFDKDPLAQPAIFETTDAGQRWSEPRRFPRGDLYVGRASRLLVVISEGTGATLSLYGPIPQSILGRRAVSYLGGSTGMETSVYFSADGGATWRVDEAMYEDVK